MENTVTINIRAVPATLWRQVRIRAAERGQTIHDFVVAALERAVTRSEERDEISRETHAKPEIR